MKTVLLIIFGAISLALEVCFFLQARYMFKHGRRAEWVLSSIQVYTIGVFLSVVAVFIPICYTGCEFEDKYTFFRPLLLAVHNAFRIFILDGDFDIVTQSLSKEPTGLYVAFTAYAALLYVVAPVLTFGNVLSLFKNIKGELYYRWCKRKKFFIMSELNKRSIALAKSIYNDPDIDKKKIVIVFTDVFEQHEERDFELLTQAWDMHAICLKKDVCHVDIISKKNDVEIFIIGDNESENISQAVRLTTELDRKNKKYNVKIFVFSSKPSAAYIIDSVKYKNLLEHAEKNDYEENCFKLRKINERQQLIWNEVPRMNLFKLADRNDKTLSVMIAGFGSYGIELFKMLVWYCQAEDYKLQINILDKQEKLIESLIQRECPELLEKNRCKDDGEAQYDIEIFSGVDMLSADLDMLLLRDQSARANRLKATNLAFVSLGDDDLNIEVAIRLRSLFDRVRGIKASKDISWEEEAVSIYSVVYDDEKSKVLHNENVAEQRSRILMNHQDIPYHIHFVGGMSSQFAYRNIYNSELEKCAYAHHKGWVDVEEKIYREFNLEEKLKELEAYKTSESVKKSREKYEQYEYFRRSSIAKELYQRAMKDDPRLVCLEGGTKQTCQCRNCIRRKKNEHMRWNAYTRAIGFSYHKKRADRALLHNNLQAWNQLPETDRHKD